MAINNDTQADDAMDSEDSLPESNQTDVLRRQFLLSMGKWSLAVVGGIAGVSTLLPSAEAAAWVNRRGAWANGGGGGWVNRGGGWANGAGGGWVNRGGSWTNGSGSGWANSRGGGGWINRY